MNMKREIIGFISSNKDVICRVSSIMEAFRHCSKATKDDILIFRPARERTVREMMMQE